MKVCFVCSFLDYQPLTTNGGYVYPDWAYSVGWAIALSSVVAVPLYAIGKLCFTEGTLREVKTPAYSAHSTVLHLFCNSSPTTNIISVWSRLYWSVFFCFRWIQRLLVLWYPVHDPVDPPTNREHPLNHREMALISPPLPDMLWVII